jgi:SAM-dependent methyltransferase
VDLAQYRQVTYDTWQRMAPGWERRRQWTWEVSRATSEWMVARLDPQPGQTVLELAAGPGETGFAAAAFLGREGRLISTDFAPQMVEAAERGAAELGLRNAEFRVMNAEQMNLGDDCVDGVLCKWGYMLMSDRAAALAETRRVLRDGGRLSLSVWGAPEENPFATIPRRPLMARGHLPEPEPGDPGIFAMGSEELIREALAGAGFELREFEPIPVEWRFDDFDDYWAFLLEIVGVVAMVMERIPEDDRAEVREQVEQEAEPYRKNGGYVIPGVTLNALAS